MSSYTPPQHEGHENAAVLTHRVFASCFALGFSKASVSQSRLLKKQAGGGGAYNATALSHSPLSNTHL
ncbi:hypothetical protein FACS1894103_3610 [Campylobacterota bacterium]|nr:hypothetical protein FACS1894103_3610 [Campylobacterota bacterium]